MSQSLKRAGQEPVSETTSLLANHERSDDGSSATLTEGDEALRDSDGANQQVGGLRASFIGLSLWGLIFLQCKVIFHFHIASHLEKGAILTRGAKARRNRKPYANDKTNTASNMSVITTTQSDIAADLDAFASANWFTSAYLVFFLMPHIGLAIT